MTIQSRISSQIPTRIPTPTNFTSPRRVAQFLVAAALGAGCGSESGAAEFRSSPTLECHDADLSGDGVVNSTDLNILALNFGQPGYDSELNDLINAYWQQTCPCLDYRATALDESGNPADTLALSAPFFERKFGMAVVVENYCGEDEVIEVASSGVATWDADFLDEEWGGSGAGEQTCSSSNVSVVVPAGDQALIEAKSIFGGRPAPTLFLPLPGDWALTLELCDAEGTVAEGVVTTF